MEVQTSPTEIVLNVVELQIDIAQAQHTKLEAAIKPVTANVKTGITWSSSNSDVASVNQTGEVEAKSTGKTVISAVTENGCATDCTITVIDSSKYAVPDPSNPSSPTGAPDTTQSPSDDTFPWWLVAGVAAGVGAVVLGGATLVVGAVIGVVTAAVGWFVQIGRASCRERV